MNNLNSILIEGYAVKKPMYKNTDKEGVRMCTFSISSNRFFKQDSGIEKKEESIFTIEAQGELAQSCVTMGQEGRGVRVVGRLKQERWDDSDGKQHSRVLIVAEHVEWRPMNATADADIQEGSEAS